MEHVATTWKDSIIPKLVEYIAIPNQSPLFDPDWQVHGFMDDAVALIEDWCVRQPIKNIYIEVIRLEGRTPLIFMEVPGDGDDCVVLYGHLDKQPEMTGWQEGLGPWKPVLRDEKLYGRGGADDGYSAFAALTAIAALQEQQIPHARCVVLIEACEESGSYDLPYYIHALETRIGTPSLAICLDSGCGNYDQFWCTTSLRGLVSGTLSIEKSQGSRTFRRCRWYRSIHFPDPSSVAKPTGRQRYWPNQKRSVSCRYSFPSHNASSAGC